MNITTCRYCKKEIQTRATVLFHGYIKSVSQYSSEPVDYWFDKNHFTLPAKSSIDIEGVASSIEQIYVFHEDCFEALSGGLYK